jgi:hypothetical protein
MHWFMEKPLKYPGAPGEFKGGALSVTGYCAPLLMRAYVHEATKNQKILQSLSNFMCNYSNEVSCKNTVHHNCTIEKKYIK